MTRNWLARNWLVVLALVAAPLFAGTAGATLVGKSNGRTVGPEMGGVDIGIAKGRVRIQCWQDGEKIIDESDLNVISLGVGTQLNALRFRRPGRPDTSVSVISQYRTSCVLVPQE